MRLTSTLVAFALAGLTLPACTKICDDARLRLAAETFAADPTHRPNDVTVLRDACPTLPPALTEGLIAGESARASTDDPAWLALLARTCPAATDGDAGKRVRDDLAGMRRLCDLDRHGLLAADAVFARDDLFVFLLHAWLLEARVDPTLAADVARPLLTAGRFAALGLTPPRGTTDAVPRRSSTQLRLTPTELAVDDIPVLSLERGRPPPNTFLRHVSPPLRTALAASAERAHLRSETTTATILADRTTPFATLADVLFTASKENYREFQLLVHDGDELHGQPFSLPRAWFPIDDYERRSHDLDLIFTVRPDAVFSVAGGINEMNFPQPAGAAIAEYVGKLKRLFPGDVVATFRIDGAIPLQAVVSLIDTVSGPTCQLQRALDGEKVPDDCLFWQVILDLDPPLHFSLGEPPTPP